MIFPKYASAPGNGPLRFIRIGGVHPVGPGCRHSQSSEPIGLDCGINDDFHDSRAPGSILMVASCPHQGAVCKGKPPRRSGPDDRGSLTA